MPIARWMFKPQSVSDHIIGYGIAVALLVVAIAVLNSINPLPEGLNITISIVWIFVASLIYMRPLTSLMKK
jgi:uncharacterized protein YhhL (DUF1145 family)